VRRGEIRRVRSWNYVGHEATGNRPCLIISPDWFNSTGNAIIAPLTTPGPNHEHWWEIHIRATDSTCLVPDIRTVPSRVLDSAVLGNATQYELDDVAFALYRLTGSAEDSPDPNCNRGEVWIADLSAMPPDSDPVMAELLILHYNPANFMAMTALVSHRLRRRSPIVFPLSPSTGLTGKSALLAQVRAISAEPRLVDPVGTVSQSDMNAISDRFTAFIES
jgi:mRNA-degrading endonuclease toxin of MazEF toxin-antitoxin module